MSRTTRCRGGCQCRCSTNGMAYVEATFADAVASRGSATPNQLAAFRGGGPASTLSGRPSASWSSTQSTVTPSSEASAAHSAPWSEHTSLLEEASGATFTNIDATIGRSTTPARSHDVIRFMNGCGNQRAGTCSPHEVPLPACRALRSLILMDFPPASRRTSPRMRRGRRR